MRHAAPDAAGPALDAVRVVSGDSQRDRELVANICSRMNEVGVNAHLNPSLPSSLRCASWTRRT